MHRHRFTVLFLVLLALVGGFLFYWVRNARRAEFVVRTDNTLIRWTANDPDSLNPIIRTDVYASYVLDYAHNFMLAWDMARNVNKPMLATGWEISEDGLDYTFPLRTDARWHDGEPFDAEDVMYSWKICMDPDIPVGWARSSYMENKITETLPVDNGDGAIAPDEYLAVELAGLPEMETPLLDGVPDAAAAVVAEGTAGRLYAARVGRRLYLAAPRLARHDTVIFAASAPGEPLRYGPSTMIAAWDALFLADSSNTQPARTGWLAGQARIKSASWAVSASACEAIIDLDELFGKQPPETLYVVAALVDDVQLEMLDRHTVRFHFPRKVFSNLDAAGYLRLVAEHYYNTGDDFMTHPRKDELMGLGPYKFKKWDRNSAIVLERWDDYWGEKPKIKRIEFKIINDAVVAFQVFRKGDVDAMDVDTWTYEKKSTGAQFGKYFYKLNFTRPGFGYVGYNCRRSFFSDHRCRQAISHLINLSAVSEHIALGLLQPTTGPFYFKEPAYDQTVPVYDYNIEAASRLLTEAGWIDHDGDGIRDKDLNGDGVYSREPLDATGAGILSERFSFEMLIPAAGADAQNNWILLSLLNNAPKVGIECRPRTVEWALFLQWMIAGDFDAQASGWNFGFETDPYDLFHTSQIKDGFNRGGYSNPVLDKMMEEARQELDRDKRAEMLREIHRMLYIEQPYTFLLGSNERWVLNDRVRDATPYDLGFEFKEWTLAGHEDGT